MAPFRFGRGGQWAPAHRLLCLLAVLAATVLFPACGGGGGSGNAAPETPEAENATTTPADSNPDEGDTLPPGVSAVLPSDGADAVLVGSAVTVTYSEPMDTAATEGAFSVSPAVTGAHTWSEDDTEQTFTPDAPLTPGASYTVTVSTDAADAAGNTLPEALTFTFLTGGSGNPVWGGMYWGFDQWKAGN